MAALVLLLVVMVTGAPGASLGTADTTPPQLLVAGEAVDGPVTLDHVVLLFDEPLDPTSMPDASDFQVLVMPPGPAPSPDPSPPTWRPAVGLELLYQGFLGSQTWFTASGASALRLDLGTTISVEDLVTVWYVPGTYPLRDPAGNPVAGFTADVILVNGINGVWAFVDDGFGPDRLGIFTSRALEPTLPPASDFTVTVNAGTPQAATAIELHAPGYGLGLVLLTLATPIAAGDVVTLTYVESSPVLTYLAGDPIGPLADLPVDVTLPATPSRATPTGTDVIVSPPDSTTGVPSATITFGSVTVAGTTTLASSDTGPAAPAGFAFGDPPVYYDLATTASFSSATVCFTYGPTSFDPPETDLRLLHYEGGAWVDTTLPGYPDTVNHVICGTVTSFSPFAIAGPPPLAFGGFRAPVDGPPVTNVAKAGSTIPVRFSLGGDYGLSIFRPGSPSSGQVSCAGGSADAIEQTVSPGSVTLTYSAGTGLYTYDWKTQSTWVGCRTLILTFRDGTSATATFRFR